jgi:hypothetical protein
MQTNASITYDPAAGTFNLSVSSTSSVNCAIKLVDATNGQASAITASAQTEQGDCVSSSAVGSAGKLFVVIDDSVTSIAVDVIDQNGSTQTLTLLIGGYDYREVTLDGSGRGWTVTTHAGDTYVGGVPLPCVYTSTANQVDVVVSAPPRGVETVYFYLAGAETPFDHVPVTGGSISVPGSGSGTIYCSSESSNPGTLTPIQVCNTCSTGTTVVDDPTGSPVAVPMVISAATDSTGAKFVNFVVDTANSIEVWLDGEQANAQTLPNGGQSSPFSWPSDFTGNWELHVEENSDPKVLIKRPCGPGN